ncbi:hypothetical protein ABE096_16850 [Robertmurraya massiliosenegalensis]|uniref:tripartite tricarboxylate transporter TctB family protein n=1 Tax=Robertmurraya TaxID=2837507 RepID=UPI0039A42C9A
MKNLANILFLIGITIFSAIYYLQVMGQSNNFEHHAVITFTIITLGILLLIQLLLDIRKLNMDDIKNFLQAIGIGKIIKNQTIILLILLTIYLFFINLLGYFVSSFLFFAIVVYWLGSRSWKQILLVPFIILVCIYMLFVTFLNQNVISGFLI